MECKAKLTDVSRDLKGGFRLTFTTGEDIRQNLETLEGVDLRLTAQKWREKRSKDANAYFHVLVGKIAQRLKTSVTAVHNQMIAGYGQPDGGMVLLRDDVDWTELETLHLKPVPGIEVVGDEFYCRYMIMRGSHTYDTAEMAALIDGTITEAKALGIETLTPAQLEEMMRLYAEHCGKKRD